MSEEVKIARQWIAKANNDVYEDVRRWDSDDIFNVWYEFKCTDSVGAVLAPP